MMRKRKTALAPGRQVMPEYQELAHLYDQRSPGLRGDIEFYLGLARQAKEPVLELGCGTGRVTLSLARAGVPIVGLDSSSSMLSLARHKAGCQEHLWWVQGDMRRFGFARRFDLVLIPYRSFSHLLTDDDQLGALRCIWDHLLPGGRLALDVFNPAIALPGSRTGVEVAGSARRGRVLLTQTSRTVRIRYLDRGEMAALLSRSGFEVEALYGWFDKQPFGPTTPEMVWVARRPASNEASVSGMG